MVKNRWLASSADPQKISLTLKALIPFILLVTGYFKLNITEGMLEEVVTGVGAVVSGALLLYGAVRKVYYAVK